jgi:hypothetical protein
LALGKSVKPYQNQTKSERAGGEAQEVEGLAQGPEFKPQCCHKTKLCQQFIGKKLISRIFKISKN